MPDMKMLYTAKPSHIRNNIKDSCLVTDKIAPHNAFTDFSVDFNVPLTLSFIIKKKNFFYERKDDP